MKRHILGVLAATIAAPYLSAFCLLVFPPSLVFESGQATAFRFLADWLGLGTFGLWTTGLPLLAIASLVAAFLNAKAWHAWWQSALSGMVLGMTLLIILTAIFSFDRQLYLLAGTGLVGAICGWIYWLTALRHHPTGI